MRRTLFKKVPVDFKKQRLMDLWKIPNFSVSINEETGCIQIVIDK